MSLRCGLLQTVLICLLAGVSSPSSWAQVRALPPNVAGAGQPRLYADVPGEFYGGGGPMLPDVSPQFQQSGPIAYQPDIYGAGLYDAPAGQASPLEELSPPVAANDQLYQPQTYRPVSGTKYWSWQWLPDGLMYKSYLAGGRESRFGSVWLYERDQGWLWDVALGGRMGVFRYGTENDVWPEGWQVDIEGASFPRMSLERTRDLVSADFRFGVPLTYREGRWEWKFSYYHLSSHLADEYMETFPAATRINFVRDAVVLGVAMRPNPDLRLYAEAGWAFNHDGGSRPWEFQFGVDYSPAEATGVVPAPFLAVNGRIREEVDFGGNFTLQTGWQWRGQTGHLFRFGLNYFNGMSDQYQFFTEHEEQIGVGLWYDY